MWAEGLPGQCGRGQYWNFEHMVQPYSPSLGGQGDNAMQSLNILTCVCEATRPILAEKKVWTHSTWCCMWWWCYNSCSLVATSLWTRCIQHTLLQVPLHLRCRRTSWSRVDWETLGLNFMLSATYGEEHESTYASTSSLAMLTQGCFVSCHSRNPTLCCQGQFSLTVHVLHVCRSVTICAYSVCIQEMEWQGMGPMKGLCDSLKRSGTHGRQPQNIKRDMMRTLGNRNPSCTVPGHERTNNIFCIFVFLKCKHMVM